MNVSNQTYQFFLEEAMDLLPLIDHGLKKIFVEPLHNHIHDISRAAHSLKGGARSAGLEDLGNIALKVEQLLNPSIMKKLLLMRN